MPAWSGLYNNIHGVDYSLIGVANVHRRFRRALKGTSKTTRAFREILRTLNGVAPGATALSTHTQVEADVGDYVNGSVRTIETVTDVDRITTAADQTAINLEIDAADTPTFPREASGNSGGGKLGY